MRWEKPCSGLDFLVGVLALTVILFALTWLGYDNGPIPKFWGDSLPFFEALARLPRMFLTAFVVMIVGVALTGIRSGRPSRRD